MEKQSNQHSAFGTFLQKDIATSGGPIINRMVDFDEAHTCLKDHPMLQTELIKSQNNNNSKCATQLACDLESKMKLEPALEDQTLCLSTKYDFSSYLVDLNLPRGPKYRCMNCREVHNTKLSMITHLKMHKDPFCSACFMIFSTDDELHKHINILHPSTILRPDITMDELIFDGHLPPPPTNTPSMSDDECHIGYLNEMPIVQFATALPSEDVDPAVLMEHKPLVIANYSHERPFRFVGGTVLDSEVNAATVAPGQVEKNRKIRKLSVKKVYKKAKRHISKKVTKMMKKTNIEEDDDDDDDDQAPTFKRVTSRFGRSINVKVSHY